ncbi:MAG: Pr6Pr family membrane protein [Pseudomonadota bacterium]
MGNKLTKRVSSKTKRTLAALLAAAGWFALALQYALLLKAAPAEQGVLESTARFLTYFTIQTNLLAAFALSGFVMKARMDEWLVHPFFRSAIAAYVVVVAIVYHTVLAKLWSPQGAQYLADALLHTAMPLGYLVFWCFCVRKAGLRWYDPLLWMIYPIAYLLAVLVRGKWSGFYPYPFMDAATLGYAKVAVYAVHVLVLFLIAGAAVLIAGRLMARFAESKDVG